MRTSPRRTLASVVHRVGLIAATAIAGVAMANCTPGSTPTTVKATLNLAATGTGSGTVTANTGGLSCQMTGATATGTCISQYDQGAAVTLTALFGAAVSEPIIAARSDDPGRRPSLEELARSLP